MDVFIFGRELTMLGEYEIHNDKSENVKNSFFQRLTNDIYTGTGNYKIKISYILAK